MKSKLFYIVVISTLIGYCEDPKLDETWYVSTIKLTLREKPDALSKAVKELSYKDAATIKGVSRVATPFSGDKNKFPDSLIPNWVKVVTSGTTGYLPVCSLVSDWLIKNQNPNELISADGTLSAKRGFSESENDVALSAMRGFSESENGDLVAMRGAVGEGKAAQSADPALVAKMLSSRYQPSEVEIADFIAKGRLQDSGCRQCVELSVEQKRGLGGFMKAARKASASGLGFASKLTKNIASEDKRLDAAVSAGELTSGLIYSEIGPVQEYQLGLALAARILPLYPLVSSQDKAARYVSLLGEALAAASNDPTPYNGYSFMLVRSDEVNAFAVPGGFVFVTTGMLNFLKNEDELAAILGHEMGHMELRHGMTSVGKEKVLKLFSLAKEVATTEVSNGKHAAVTEQLKTLADNLFDKMVTSIRNGYGIEMESQADWRSVQFSKTLGYDTKALYDVLERFKAVKGSYGGASYPVERGSDVLKYRENFACQNEALSAENRVNRYRNAIGE